MDPKEKLFVFDLNGTLLKRVKTGKEEMMHLRKPDIILPCRDLVYLRPMIKELALFLHSNNIKYIFWTTAHEHNGIPLVNAIKAAGMNNALEERFGTHSSPIPGHPYKRSKDMHVLAEKYETTVSNVFLIDDEAIKCIPQESYISITEYDPKNHTDSALTELISTLQSLIAA